MKKFIYFTLLFSFTTHYGLFAQTVPAPQTVSTENTTPQKTAPAATVAQGSAAAVSTNTARNTSWQNWIFAGTALVIAAVGVIAIAVNHGEDNPTAH